MPQFVPTLDSKSLRIGIFTVLKEIVSRDE
jgi:hypothetical protein